MPDLHALSGSHSHGALNGVRRLRIALAQINVTVGALSANVARIVDAAGEAHKAGAQIVIFPELALTGLSAGKPTAPSQALSPITCALWMTWSSAPPTIPA